MPSTSVLNSGQWSFCSRLYVYNFKVALVSLVELASFLDLDLWDRAYYPNCLHLLENQAA